MVSIVIDSDKQTTSKVISFRARPQLPQRLVKEAFLTDKLELNVFESSPEEGGGRVRSSSHSEFSSDCTDKSKQLRNLFFHDSRLSEESQSIKNELTTSIDGNNTNRNSGDEDRKKILKSTSLFRHLTLSGLSPSMKNFENFKNIKTCKVQPIRVTQSSSCDESNEAEATLGKLAPLAKEEEEENEEDEKDVNNQLEDKLKNLSGYVKPSQLSQILQQNKIQRSDSDSSSKLKSFCLRRPRTMDKFCGSELSSHLLLQPSRPSLASLRKNKSCTSSQTITENPYQDISQPQKFTPDFTESCKHFLLERARPKKPTTLLLRQNSIDMSGQESAIGDNHSDTSPGIHPPHCSRNRKKVARSNTVEGIECSPIPIFMKHTLKPNLVKSTDALNIASETRRSSSNEHRNIDSELDSPAAVSDHEMIINAFNVSNATTPHSEYSSPGRTSPTLSKALLTSPKSSKSKISKKKSSRMAASLVKNVPALFSGLKKSLPLQVAKSLSPPSTPNEEKKIPCLPSSNSSTNRKTIKDLKTHSTSSDKVEPTVSRSDSKNKETTQHNSNKPQQQQKIINNHKTLHVTTTNQTQPTTAIQNDLSKLNVNEVSPTPREDHHPPHQIRGRPSITPSLETCLSNVSLFSSTSEDVVSNLHLLMDVKMILA